MRRARLSPTSRAGIGRSLNYRRCCYCDNTDFCIDSAFCGIRFAGGIDRLRNGKSYADSIAHGTAVPCCSVDNRIKGSHKVDDLLVNNCRIVMHVAETWDPERIDLRHISLFTTPTTFLPMLHTNSYERLPVKVVINGVVAMFPSESTLRNFGFAISPGTVITHVTSTSS